MATTFSFNKIGLGHFAARLLLLPFVVALMSILYSHSSLVQSRIFLQTGGLIFNVLTLFYVAGIAATSLLCKSKGRLIKKNRQQMVFLYHEFLIFNLKDIFKIFNISSFLFIPMFKIC